MPGSLVMRMDSFAIRTGSRRCMGSKLMELKNSLDMPKPDCHCER
jgi:hypothetical protein